MLAIVQVHLANEKIFIIVAVAGTVYSQSNNLNLKNRLTINNSIDLPKDI